MLLRNAGTIGTSGRVIVHIRSGRSLLAWTVAQLDARGVPRNANWLALAPSGPHMAGDLMRRQVAAMGGVLSFNGGYREASQLQDSHLHDIGVLINSGKLMLAAPTVT